MMNSQAAEQSQVQVPKDLAAGRRQCSETRPSTLKKRTEQNKHVQFNSNPGRSGREDRAEETQENVELEDLEVYLSRSLPASTGRATRRVSCPEDPQGSSALTSALLAVAMAHASQCMERAATLYVAKPAMRCDYRYR